MDFRLEALGDRHLTDHRRLITQYTAKILGQISTGMQEKYKFRLSKF